MKKLLCILAGRLPGLLLVVGCILLSGCPEQSETRIDDQGASYSAYDWQLPEGIPLPREPANNPMTEAKFQLGRHLFYDKRLSMNGTISCASCHHQDKAFSDGLAQPLGAAGTPHPRNSQALVNVAWYNTLTWGNPVLTSIEQQIVLPLFGDDPIEHGISSANSEQVLMNLQADPVYAPLFADAFPEQDAPLFGDNAYDNIVKSLASFVRGLTSYDSPFDRNELSGSAKRGAALFNSEKLECFHCHAGYNFSDATVDRTTSFIEKLFHNNGLYNIDGLGGYPEPNTGRYELTGTAHHMGQFRAPSLRNVALTAPYNHDGSVETLEDVIRNYANGGRNISSGPHSGDGRMNPHKDGFIVSFPISDPEIADLVAFLESLTDQTFINNPRFANPWTESSQQDPAP